LKRTEAVSNHAADFKPILPPFKIFPKIPLFESPSRKKFLHGKFLPFGKIPRKIPCRCKFPLKKKNSINESQEDPPGKLLPHRKFSIRKNPIEKFLFFPIMNAI